MTICDAGVDTISAINAEASTCVAIAVSFYTLNYLIVDKRIEESRARFRREMQEMLNRRSGGGRARTVHTPALKAEGEPRRRPYQRSSPTRQDRLNKFY